MSLYVHTASDYVAGEMRIITFPLQCPRSVWKRPHIDIFKGSSHIGILHPYAQVLAMSAFDSYSQSKRSPRPLSRHRPCKTPFPIGNASFNKPWPNYHGSIMFYSFWSNPIGTPVSNGPFFVGTVDATNKNAKQALFLVCILQDGFW